MIVQDLSTSERVFLGAMMRARGKWYVSKAQRGFVASLALELSDPLDDIPRIAELLGEPAKRNYYGRPVYRYVTQDKDKIAGLLAVTQDFLAKPGQFERARTMIGFCTAESTAARLEFAKTLGSVDTAA